MFVKRTPGVNKIRKTGYDKVRVFLNMDYLNLVCLIIAYPDQKIRLITDFDIFAGLFIHIR